MKRIVLFTMLLTVAAAGLGFVHPKTGEVVEWQAPLPEDMAKLIEACRQDTKVER